MFFRFLTTFFGGSPEVESQMSETKVMEQTEEKVELPNQCLGNNPRTKKRCANMLPEGKHICSHCQRRINLAGRHASKLSSGNGHQSGNLLTGSAE